MGLFSLPLLRAFEVCLLTAIKPDNHAASCNGWRDCRRPGKWLARRCARSCGFAAQATLCAGFSACACLQQQCLAQDRCPIGRPIWSSRFRLLHPRAPWLLPIDPTGRCSKQDGILLRPTHLCALETLSQPRSRLPRRGKGVRVGGVSVHLAFSQISAIIQSQFRE